MYDFYDGPTTTAPGRPAIVTATRADTVATRASVTPAAPAAHLMASDGDWDATTLRDFILRQHTERFGAPLNRNPAAEIAICRAFIGRWGAQGAAAIARHAFSPRPGCDGYWSQAPIGFSRFTANSDQYFAAEIAKRLGVAA